MTTAQSAYPKSHNKFSRYFCFNCFLFQTKIHADLFLPVSSMIKWKVMLPLYNNQILLSGANTGQSGGRSLLLGYVSLGSQTPKLKKVKWKKIKFCQLLYYIHSSLSTVMICQCIKSCFICLCECTSSNSCYPVFAYLPFLFWFASKYLFRKSNHGSYLCAFYL